MLALTLMLISSIIIAAFYIIHIKRRLARDITEREQTELREQSRNRVLEMLAQGAPLGIVLEAIVRGVEQQHPTMLCSILLLDIGGKHLLTGAAPSLPDFYNTAINGIEIGIGVGSCGTAAFTGQRVIVEDVQTHPYWSSYKELARRGEAGLVLVGTDSFRFRQGARHICHL